MENISTLGEALRCLCEKIEAMQAEGSPVVVFLEGRCGSGKTTLAAALAETMPCLLFHMDDFFLPMAQKTAARLAEPGGNVDHERFLREVLLPLRRGEPFSYRPFDCGNQALGAPVAVAPGRLALVEGVYCCRPELWDFADLHVFLDVAPKVQAARILARNGGKMAARFREEWIPLEETYFSAFRIPERCELTFALEGF